MKKTIDMYLRNSKLENKDIVVVGPSDYVDHDPSALFFANLLYRHTGSLSILDIPKRTVTECHGDIGQYMDGFHEYISDGIEAIEPKVYITDVTRTRLSNKFDVVFECTTLPYICGLKQRDEGANLEDTAIKVIYKYLQMLREGGSIIIAYRVGFGERYTPVLQSLKLNGDYHLQIIREPGTYRGEYSFRNIRKNAAPHIGKHTTPKKAFVIESNNEPHRIIRINVLSKNPNPIISHSKERRAQ